MKLSMMKNTGKGGGPCRWTTSRANIAKFPSTAFPRVSENEFANLALAAAIGMEVPERELVEKSYFEGIPEEFNTLSEGKVLLVKRFDREAKGERIHIKDLAQVFGVYPSRKYEWRRLSRNRLGHWFGRLAYGGSRIRPPLGTDRHHWQWRAFHRGRRLTFTVLYRTRMTI